uniref:CCHC-type domain-containing protein n=1 Tax=Glossina pallidipes TaxID=7398 RepID=A0A1B0ACK6_GLOPL
MENNELSSNNTTTAETRFSSNVIYTKKENLMWEYHQNIGCMIVPVTILMMMTIKKVVVKVTDANEKERNSLDSLERKYHNKHVKEVTHLELSSRCQKLNGRIQDYATEIGRLANLAYSGVPDDVLERLKIDAFVKGLRDAELKKAVWTSPKTTLGFTLTQETASVLWTSSMKVRRTEVTSESDISDVVCAALRQVLRENKRMPASKTRKCYACQKSGYFARECRPKHKRSHSTSSTRNISASEISNERALKRVSTAGQRLTKKFSSSRDGITQSKRSNSSLTIDGKIQGCNYIITLDTGASHSIINSTIVKEPSTR